MKKTIGAVLVFILTYALFSAAGFLFPVDRDWYDALHKPEWTPSGSAIGIIWAILFALISLAAAIIFAVYTFRQAKGFWIVLFINYILNQAFSYFQFSQKSMLAASIDCLLVAVTALIVIVIANKLNKAASYLLLPYFLWSAFATYLSFTIYSMNL
ncbi:TspO/MBR family protein [Bacillus atrophaeus]|uniref:TspO/MBR family protein n=1 Tax=Bacillus atrophaeus TaxID=1452 RepID=UPI00077A5D8F|nr:tryptophan-rich sensory protein [Bacillus atrophaeus]KXZ17590.1 hypothetical protein AXI57_19810 [Bacillus atrophaeus]MCY8810557.1 tryptophan-rich sensory protein [Bacillus atrophaeus]MCY8944636.1 tryptophan-rich sensory protein [Bacillus atrophaeus]MCY8961688.1 tryptophan-rich sensory protein [Bacillus atrophaeus]MCY8965934.1 tryptophan-rich sensory protein [Bacillus atrophaeus]